MKTSKGIASIEVLVVSTVKKNKGLGFEDLVRRVSQSINDEPAIKATIWHLLSAEKLSLTTTRKIELPST